MLAGSVILASIAAGLALGAASRRRPLLDRAGLAILPPALAAVASLLASEFVQSFFRSWNDARLAPGIAWLRGVPLYQGLEQGPLLGLMYPPVAALAFLPAAWGATPEGAVAIGEMLTLVYYFLPALGVLWIEGRRMKAGTPLVATAACAFVLAAGVMAPLSGPAFWIHADAPALGLAAIACAAVSLGSPRAPAREVALASTAAILAVLAKQVAVPIMLVVPLVAWLRGGKSAALRHAAGQLVAGGIAGGLILLLTDARAFVLNVVIVPSRHPWTGPAAGALGAAAGELLLWCLAPLALVAACLLASPRPGAAMRAARWTPWAVAAVAMAPTALLGRVKLGGGANALAFTVYFAVIAALVALLEHAAAGAEGERARIPAMARGLLLLATAIAAVPALRRLEGLPRLMAVLPANPERVGFSLASARPGFAYFPANPLVGLYAEGRAYHFSDGVYIRRLAGLDVSRAHVEAFVPSGMKIIVFQGREDFSSSYLPEFSEPVTLEGLPPTMTARAKKRP